MNDSLYGESFDMNCTLKAIHKQKPYVCFCPALCALISLLLCDKMGEFYPEGPNSVGSLLGILLR